METTTPTARALDATGESLVQRYLDSVPRDQIVDAALAFFASLDHVRASSPHVAASILRELADQRSNVKLIASENYSSLAVQLAQGNLFTDKYAEGYPGQRFYAGCDNVDDIESEAVGLARQLFGADHAYVQPHSGADANLIAFAAILSTRVEAPTLARLGEENAVTASRKSWEEVRTTLHRQKLLALDYFSGGHLTHGYRHNFSSRLFDTYWYTVDRETNLLNPDSVRARLHEVRPLIFLVGYSAYTRLIDFAAMREMADEVGAVLMVDMAHFAGLVAGGVFRGDNNPVPFAHVLTSTTHKTLRGPRGGMVLCTEEFAPAVDKGCPAVMGGPLPHVIAAKAVAFREAVRPEFSDYAHRIVENARALADGLRSRGVNVVTGGTDNHMVLVDVTATYGITGRHAESALRACGMTMNRNAVPFDKNGPWYTSGLRLGTPAITTLGMGASEIDVIADVIAEALKAVHPTHTPSGELSKAKYELAPEVKDRARARIRELLDRYPVYPEIDLDVALATKFGQGALRDSR
jgi:glycine hydroxymethyltransferase